MLEVEHAAAAAAAVRGGSNFERLGLGNQLNIQIDHGAPPWSRTLIGLTVPMQEKRSDSKKNSPSTIVSSAHRLRGFLPHGRAASVTPPVALPAHPLVAASETPLNRRDPAGFMYERSGTPHWLLLARKIAAARASRPGPLYTSAIQRSLQHFATSVATAALSVMTEAFHTLSPRSVSRRGMTVTGARGGRPQCQASTVLCGKIYCDRSSPRSAQRA
jgi:hypothetical protein